MRIIIQRVTHASVTIAGKRKAEIGQGLLIFLGIETEDTAEDIDFLCKKTINLRIFDDPNGVMNCSVMDVGGELLCVSQFTLYASTRKGNRPSYIRAARPEIAIPLYEQFCNELEVRSGRRVQTGEFGACMQVELANDGPVTIMMDSKYKE
ncbi:MAG: D-tyrosyl-tRNA(Tyr) deacylase [Dysgonamonadaceae bacterium]|jgi:D-tyrosyl-tRNA(Tyr) deacylase|nr:D-tyrosyl-tRNA(Tyr) deacylase [Dysgonamonadaceae bacterium]